MRLAYKAAPLGAAFKLMQLFNTNKDLKTKMKNSTKVVQYNLEASEFNWEIAPGKIVQAWGLNNMVPGPELKANVGDTMVIRVTNKLSEPTMIHWHGLRIPAAMDGTGEVQKPIQPGEEFEYRFIVPDAGNSENLQMTSDGRYISSLITGVEGRTYNLNVIAEGKTFTATSTLPFQINLDSLWVDSLSFFGGKTYILTSQYTDAPGIANYYRFNLFVNETRDKNIFTENDDFSDGRTVANPKFADQEIEQNDTLRLQMICIDKSAYLYFFSLAAIQTGSTGAPANPVSNFTGGCLGFFSAHTFQEKTVVVN